MSRTLSDKIIDNHLLGEQGFHVFERVSVDAVLGHDATIALLIDEFRRRNLKVWDGRRVLFANDHFSPPATPERADISNKFLRFARESGVEHVLVDRGICHQLLVEHNLCRPGSLIVGADSHTIMAGALGACATGMGSTDILFTLATGTTWLRRPKTIMVTFIGRLPSTCSGRDLALELLRLFGESGASYCTLEFHDHCNPKLGSDDRFAISNMAVEMGAKFGIFVPDEVTIDYCRVRDGETPEVLVRPDSDCTYDRTIEVDATWLTPKVAKPWSPANVVAITDLEPTPITSAFLGSCSGGRLRDIRDATEVLAGRCVHPAVRFVVIPASSTVLNRALELGYIQTLLQAGAVLNQPSCGPCGGIDKGVLGSEDVCVSTSNRNFRGRMGHWNSRTFLASARTVARSALLGRITPDLYTIGPE